MIAVFNMLLIVGAIQGFVFNIVTFLLRKKIEKPILFLNLFIFFISMNNLQTWLIENTYISSNFFLSYFRIPWYVLIVPMFYAFVRTYLGVEKRKRSFLPMSFFVFFIEFLSTSTMILLIQQKILLVENLEHYYSLEDAFTLGYSLFIFYNAITLIYNYDKLLIPVLSFDDLDWLKRFVRLGGLVMLLWLLSVLFNNFSVSIRSPYNYYPLRLGSSILIYWIGYQGFFRYVILKDRIDIRKELKKEIIQQNSRTKDLQKTQRQESVFHDVNTYILNNHKYLNPNFSLEKLSEELNIGTTKLSLLINQYSDYNFSDYLNKLRVEKAKILLKDSSYKAYTIVSIGLECGFNSKSTFYAAFKKFTDVTPTQFRKQIIT
jgi:AraC-like DNA-binding protein